MVNVIYAGMLCEIDLLILTKWQSFVLDRQILGLMHEMLLKFSKFVVIVVL